MIFKTMSVAQKICGRVKSIMDDEKEAFNKYTCNR
jgi:hypothetical protein